MKKYLGEKWGLKIIPLGIIVLLLVVFYNPIKERIKDLQDLNFILIAVILAGLLILIYQVFKAPDWISSFFPLIILLITIISFYALGSPIDKINLQGLASILVLFFLSELAVGLTVEIIKVKNENRIIQELMDETRTRFSDLITKSDFVTAAKEVSRITEIFSRLRKIDNPRFSEALFRTITERYTNAWIKIFEDVKDSREDSKEKMIHLICWESLIENYIEMEEDDLNYSRPFNGKQKRMPTLASDERIYLNLIKKLAESMMSEDVLYERSGRKIVFLAISHVLPEYWYNWEHSDGYYAYRNIDGYRNTIKKIVHDFRGGKNVEVRRLILVGNENPYYKQHGVKSKEELLNQHNKVLITLQPAPGEIFDSPPSRPLMEEVIKEYPEIEKDIGMPEAQSKEKYFIVGKECLEKLRLIGNGKRKTLELGSRIISISIENLIEKYMKDLHLGRSSSQVGYLPHGFLEHLPMAEDPDMLMVGYKDLEDKKVRWQLALSTNLKPGHKTLLLHIIYDKELLCRIEKFWKEDLKGRTCSIKNTSKIEKLC